MINGQPTKPLDIMINHWRTEEFKSLTLEPFNNLLTFHLTRRRSMMIVRLKFWSPINQNLEIPTCQVVFSIGHLQFNSINFIKLTYLERSSMKFRILSLLVNYSLGCSSTPNCVYIQRELQQSYLFTKSKMVILFVHQLPGEFSDMAAIHF
jgi:hypothetical protein